MKWLLYIFVLIFWGTCSKADQDWWKHAVFYQVYPRSFKDSDGDGIGDIKGIISKVNHFKDAGVDAIWLSPIYKSPQVDQGYDVSDFKAIDEQYGTMEDFKELLEKAHDLGIKVIMDFIPNHSSNQHEWFIKSEDGEEEYKDYYVWRDKPNNWVSSFKGTAWTYSEKRKQYYYHQYAIEQPDLNYRNEKVVEEIKDIMTFWLDIGIDGFRIDAVGNLFEDSEFRDEPLSGVEGATEEDFEYLNHIYTKHQPETLDMVHQFRKLVDEYTEEHGGDARVIMTEVYADIEDTLKYYGTEDGSELRAHFTFNFQLITKLDSDSTAKDVVNAVNEWLDYMPLIYTPNWVLGNHDNHRVASRFGPENVDGFNMLVALLPGVQVTYNGEEIGQEDGEVTYEEGWDPSACKNSTSFPEISRDFERTPFHWDRSKNAGFSDGDKTWLPVSEKYLETNLADESVDGVDSHYHVYQNLIKLRKQPTFEKGKLKLVVASDNVLAFSRSLQGYDTYVCLFNMGETSQNVNLIELFNFDNTYFEVSIASVNSAFKKGSLHNTSIIAIAPHESIVIRMIIPGDLDWWKTAAIYQIYPRSFKDSNGDGFGDLKGIASKAQFFKDTGVDTVLLTSIFQSPEGYHDGYVSDYKEIDPYYGTMEDFEELLKTLHEIGIKVILEFIPNHSSIHHKWFELSESKSEGYDNFYVWKDPVDGNEPNNWLSVNGGSAWEFSDKRRQYYLHQFTKEQPDLNYRSDALQQEIKDILIFWLDKGVDGFSIDSASFLLEDEEFKDEPLLGSSIESYNDLDHIYTQNQKETYDLIYQFRELLDDYNKYHSGDARILLTEALGSIDKITLFYGSEDGSELGAQSTFNYQLVENVHSESNAKDVVDAINIWLDYKPVQYTSNWMLGDHNHHRVATRLGNQNVDGYNIVTALFPGMLITYYGEEIGMEDGEVTFQEGDDPNGCNNESSFNELSRDFERTPYHWDATKNAGFSDADKTWLPVSEKYLETNLAAENVDDVDSHYHVYQQLLKLRQLKAFKSGKMKVVAVSRNILAYSRMVKGFDPYVVLFNLGTSSSETVNLADVFGFVAENVEVILSSVGSSFTKGTLHAVNNLEIKPHECIVVRVIQKGESTWWKHALFYQIYPRSFKDSNSDGIGDLKGITSKLSHLVDTGVDAVWISSIYQVSNIDGGISDFKAISSDYGTIEDFEELLEEAHALGIKVIIDFIPNHSSDQHEWFTLSQSKTSIYKDYYIWKDGVDGDPPNNWLSHSKNSAWEYSTTRKQYYLHQFSKQEPDLNYRSEALVTEILEIMLFWLDKGVDGFGVDTISYLIEHEDFADEPLSGENVDSNDYAYLNHIYTKDRPETYEILYKFRKYLDSYTQYHGGDARVLVAVTDSGTEKTMLYYGTDDGTTLGAHFALNFNLITKIDKDSTARNLVDAINEWLNYMPLQYTANWLLGNHNYHRIATRLCSDNLDGFNMLIALLPGVQITYNGEEIGMEDGEVTLEEGVDVGDCNTESCYKENSRDFERTPYHWDKSKNAGFSDADHTWLPVSKKYLETNLAAEETEGIASHYHIYQELKQLRQKDAIREGKLKIKAISNNVFALTRYLVDGDAYVYVINLGSTEEKINLFDVFGFGPSIQILLTSLDSALNLWAVYDAKDITIAPHESFVGIFTEESPGSSSTSTESTTSTITSSETTATTETEPSSTSTIAPDEDSSANPFITNSFLLLLSAVIFLFVH